MISFGQLKTDLGLRIWPQGSAPNLVIPHNASFVDAIIDLQTWVDCLKRDNRNLLPQCSTLFHCGLTVFDAPRGNILKLSVIDRLTAAAAVASGVTLVGAAPTVTTDFVQARIFDAPPAPRSVFTTTRSGPIKVTVNHSSNVAGLQSPGPQYVLVTISYTDTNGAARTSQPAGQFLWGSEDSVSSATINCASGTSITATVTVSNVPFTDGEYTISVTCEDVGISGSGGDSVTAETGDDWCSEINYKQVDFCNMRRFISTAQNAGCCFDTAQFFALPTCGKNSFPIPTDAGLSGLPLIPLGYHYGQKSTDTIRRARHGVWAMERGKIYVAPWIQSTETIIIKWDGIKRSWNDADLMDDDPLLLRAIENYVAWEHYSKWEKDTQAAADAVGRYNEARSMLMYQCDEENRTRNCETSRARGSSVSSASGTGSLYYNDAPQSYTAKCQSGTTGTDIAITISAGTVASNVSVSDANQLALNQAQLQAIAQLDCTDVPPSFTNDAQSFTAQCVAGSGAPTPTGNSVTRTVPAGAVTSSVSKATANAAALAQAEAEAEAALGCVWSNAQQTAVAVCESDNSKTQTVTLPAGAYTSSISQDDANLQAANAAQSQANTQLAAAGCVSAGGTAYANTQQIASSIFACRKVIISGGHAVVQTTTYTVQVIVAAGIYSSFTSQAEANHIALSYGTSVAQGLASQNCAAGGPQNQTINYP